MNKIKFNASYRNCEIKDYSDIRGYFPHSGVNKAEVEKAYRQLIKAFDKFMKSTTPITSFGGN